MCFVGYIASSKKLPLIGWEISNPKLNVAELSSHELPVRQQFSLPNVAYLGSHLGCGCGFLKEDASQEEISMIQSNYDNLSIYIGNLRQDGALCAVYFLMDGDQGESPDFFEQISMKELVSPEFEFVEGAHYEFA